jgi:serine/threonine protein kinase
MAVDYGDREREVLDFLADYALDCNQGLRMPLRHYLARYPGREEAVAREFLDLRRGDIETKAERVGSYETIALLGRGGQGNVFLARDTRMNREVALKVLHDGLRSAISPARFRRAAELIARLDHDGLEHVYEFGEERDQLWLATRYVRGASLAELLQQSRPRSKPGPLALPDAPPPQDTTTRTRAVLHLIADVARSLHAAHEASVLHRDIKPGNILVPPGRHPVLVDFGLARAIDAKAVSSLTLPGDVLGTPAYMAPELLAASTSGGSRASDLWALAVVLYECLTQRQPFQATSAAALQRTIAEQPLPVLPFLGSRSITNDIQRVLTVALAKDPALRYRDAATFAEDIERIASGQPPLARPPGAWRRVVGFTMRHPVAVSVGISVLTLLVLALAYVEGERRRADTAMQLAQDRTEDLMHISSALVHDLHHSLQQLPGTTEASHDLLRTAITYLELLESRHPDGTVLRDLVQGHLLAGDVLGNPRQPNLGRRDEAREHYALAIQLLDGTDLLGTKEKTSLRAAALLRLGELAARDGQPAAAAVHWAAGLDLIGREAVDMATADLEVTFHLRLGELLPPLDIALARQELAAAIDKIARLRGATPDLAGADLQELRAHLLLARLASQTEDLANARIELARCQQILGENLLPPSEHAAGFRRAALEVSALAALNREACDHRADADLIRVARECTDLVVADPRDQESSLLMLRTYCDHVLISLRLGQLDAVPARRLTAFAAAYARRQTFGVGWGHAVLSQCDRRLAKAFQAAHHPHIAAALLASDLSRQNELTTNPNTESLQRTLAAFRCALAGIPLASGP